MNLYPKQMIVLIDNTDSFVYILARYVEELGFQTIVLRSFDTSIKAIEAHNPTHIIISPGPCTPNEAGITLEAIAFFAPLVPILGVCLGHQAIGQAFGGQVVRATRPCHGKQDLIMHHRTGLFAGLPLPLKAARYHSLVIEPTTLPDSLQVIAWNHDKVIMAVRHCEYPTFGVQFHPESILTEFGHELLKNFLTH